MYDYQYIKNLKKIQILNYRKTVCNSSESYALN
jgi:hypothetical protein